MKTILLDTNAYTGLLAGSQDVLDMIATAETADVFGMVKSRLKAAGTPLPINDVWIAAHAIETGSIVVTFDRHFSKVPGLRLWDGIGACDP